MGQDVMTFGDWKIVIFALCVILINHAAYYFRRENREERLRAEENEHQRMYQAGWKDSAQFREATYDRIHELEMARSSNTDGQNNTKV